ncbi:MAG TPA: class I SAM-dependent methyltransferase [Rubrivivax sp.]|nr:class I SAM-dependent methyltransferase [Rubrivivax sp.]
MQPTEDYRASHLTAGDHYDDRLAAEPFDAYMAHWEQVHLDALVRECFPSGVSRYLDFACGTGRAISTLAPLSKDAVGVDVSPSMLKVAQAKVPGATFHLADLTKDDPDLGTFDLITSFRFFGNAQDALREGVLRALVKRLAPEGFLVINSHRNPRALYSLFGRVTGGNAGGMDLHLGKLRRLLQAHGLKIRHQRPIGAWMFRSRMLGSVRPDAPAAAAKERRFSSPLLAGIAPDAIIVAQRS